MRFAGGKPSDDEMSLDEFLVQAQEYETGGNAIDAVFKALNVAFRTHPFNTVRAAELQRWLQSGGYDHVMNGDYPRRDGASGRPLADDYVDAAGYYGQQARGAVDQVTDLFKSARDAFTGAFRGTSSK
jgi:hypothetical protein